MQGIRENEKAHHPIDTTHLLEFILGKISKANFVVKVLLPALDAAVDTNGDVALLTDDTAVAASLVASSQVCEGISKIVKLGTLKDLGRHVVLEPEHLGHLHLDAHLAANVLEKLVLGVVDLLGLLDRSMVKPQNDVPVVAVICKVRPCDGQRLIGIVGENSEGAGGVKANALDLGRVDGRLADDPADTFADALPDVCGRLLLGAG